MDEYTAELTDYRQRKDTFFGTANSPLPAAERASFQGLAYYPPDARYRFTLPVEPGTLRETVLGTSTGQEATYVHHGTVRLTVDGNQGSLQLYARPGDAQPEQFFVPYRDATSGTETYGAGRYLEAPVHDGLVTLDFNLAYHPYCAYAEGWTCPLPPAENWLPFAVRAGERLPT